MRRKIRTAARLGAAMGWLMAIAVVLPTLGAAAEPQRHGDWQVISEAGAAAPAASTRAARDSRPDGDQAPRLVVRADYRGVELEVYAAVPPATRVAYRAVEIRLGSRPAEAITGLLSADGERIFLFGQIEPEVLKPVTRRFIDGLKRANTLQLRVTDPEDLRQRVLTFSLEGSTAALEAIGY